MEDGAPHPPAFSLDQVSSWELEKLAQTEEALGAPAQAGGWSGLGGLHLSERKNFPSLTEGFLGRSLSEE